MIVRKGVEPGNVSVDDFEMMSAASDKIVLPFIGKIWGELRLEAEQIMLSAMNPSELDDFIQPYYDGFARQINTKFMFNIQRSGVCIVAHINTENKNGTTAFGRVLILTTLDEVRPILDRFFSTGCCGLSEEYAKYYQKIYTELLKK